MDSEPTRFSQFSSDFREAEALIANGTAKGFIIREADWIKVIVPFATSNTETRTIADDLRIKVLNEDKSKREEARWQAVSVALWGGLLPPALVFAIGAAVGWALSGFRKNT